MGRLNIDVIMGAAEARALWQRRASRCFLVHEDATSMPPRLACCHQQHSSSSSSSAKNSFSSASFGDSSDSSSDTKWWLKGSLGFDEEIAKSFLQDTNFKKLHEFVDLTGISKEEDYSFISKNDIATTPWWRSTTDQDELALLVATRSLDHHIQNCDLPPPQKLHKSIHCTTGEKGFQTAVNSPWKQRAWSHRFERSLSYSSSSSTESKNTSPKSSPGKGDLSKTELLEALRHSQSRAREAEKAAKEACTEKDRLITILMRQASQILACKQWIKLLEMESLYLQMRREDEEEQEQVEDMNLKKSKQRGKKKKNNNKMGEIGRYMMAFALGFSLIGAGLLLGWTVGWLFPL